MLRDQDMGRFVAALSLVAAPHRVELDDIAIAAFRIGLEDFAIEQIEDAARWLVKRSDRWPSVPEWTAAVSDAHADALVRQADILEKQGRMLPAARQSGPLEAWCGLCGDTGWALVGPEGVVIEHTEAARMRAESPDWVERVRACTCRATNPVYQEDLKRSAARAIKRSAASKRPSRGDT